MEKKVSQEKDEDTYLIRELLLLIKKQVTLVLNEANVISMNICHFSKNLGYFLLII